jgi:tetratricopeptide (TPR) repeat protein
MPHRYFTWDEFLRGLRREARIAQEVFEKLVVAGLRDNCLARFEFVFVSDRRESLERLQSFLVANYGSSIESLEAEGPTWELNGVTDAFPVTDEYLLYWALDMYKRGYEYDARMEAYTTLFDRRYQTFPALNASHEAPLFEQGVDQYRDGNLSGALVSWSLVLSLNPRNAEAYFSRAVVKNELHVWKAALRDYDEALRLSPDYIGALTNRGSLRDDHGDHAGAIGDYNRAIALAGDRDSNKAMAYFNRGNAKLHLRDLGGARDDWQRALELGASYAREALQRHRKI